MAGRRTVASARTRLAFALLVLALVALTGCAGTRTTAAARSATMLTFTGTTVDGKPFDAATLPRKPTVLWFWAPLCTTCLRQGLALRDVLATTGTDVTVIGIGGLAKASEMPEFVRLTKLGVLTQIADEAGVIWKQFGVTEQSFFVFLDASGVETARAKLPPDEIAARLAAPAARPPATAFWVRVRSSCHMPPSSA